MARRKKESAAPLKWEDVPEIPREEQPYPLPEGWKWVPLSYGYDITSSKRIHKSDWRSTGIPFYRTRELVKLSDKGFVDNELFIEEKVYEKLKELYGVPTKNDILISGVGTIGVPYVIENENEFYFKDGNIIWLKNKDIFFSKYIFYLFKSNYIKNCIHEMSCGTTVDTYTIVNAKRTKIPYPPLEIQKRIVTRIESLFSKLDEAAEKVQAVIDRHEARKQAILHQAFSGELTKQWREENGVSLDGWREMTLQAVCATKITDGTHQTPTYADKNNGIPFLSSKDVTKEFIDWDNIKYIPHGLHEELYKRLSPKKDDILLAKNGTTGVAAIVPDDRVFDIYVSLALLRPNKGIINEYYLLYILNSSISKEQFNSKLKGIGLPNLHLRDIRSVVIPVPSLLEQNEICRQIFELKNKQDTIFANCNSIIHLIAKIKSHILGLAFEGKLLEN